MATSFRVPFVALSALLLVAAFGINPAQGLAAAVPSGLPYLTVNITSPGGYDEAAISTEFAAALATEYPDNTKDFNLASITAANVAQYAVQENITTDVTQVSLVILLGTRDDKVARPLASGRMYQALQRMITVMNGASPFTGRTVEPIVAGDLFENIPATTTLSYLNFGLADSYDGQFAPENYVILDYGPEQGTSVTLQIDTVSNDIVTDPSPIVITWPENSAVFKMRDNSKGVGVYNVVLEAIAGTTDSRGTAGFARNTSQGPTGAPFTVKPLENLVLKEPAPTITYNGTFTPDFTIKVPSGYRDANPQVKVDIAVTPALGVSITANGVVQSGGTASLLITARDVEFPFSFRAPIGTYSVAYTLDKTPPSDGTSNVNFNNPAFSSNIRFYESLNITTSQIPDAYMISQYVPNTDYGGAYTFQMPVQLERSPTTGIIVTLASDDDSVIFYPSSVLNFDVGRSILWFVARATTIGHKTISMTVSGANQLDYYPIKDRQWIVHGPRQDCFRTTDSNLCWTENGCVWNEALNLCSNHTLPVKIGNIPQLFNGEPSGNITVTLPTKARGSLTIELVATARLTFSPQIVNLAPGEFEFNFTVTGSLNADELAAVRQNFYLRMSGDRTVANTYAQQETWAEVRPSVVCTITKPNNFFVGTSSDEFTMSCDTPPEVRVEITPVEQTGIVFTTLGSTANSAKSMLLTPTTRVGSFIATSVGGVTGSFQIAYQITGPNAARHASITPTTIIIYPSGEVLTPPTFYLTAYEETPELNMDITVVAPKPLEVSIVLQDLAGNNITHARVDPEIMLYNNTRRGLLKVYGEVPGEYQMVFNISGENKANYINPPPKNFFIQDRYDGSAFTARLGVGFVPATKCRVNVGRNSHVFKGQDQVDDESGFCDTYAAPPANYSADCTSFVTEERCRNELQVNGWLCVWHKEQCAHVTELQGKVKSVAFGSSYTLLLDQNGTVWSIGSTRYGQLGHYNDYLSPVEGLPDGVVVAQVVAGTSHSMALTNDGYVYAWGVNSRGQLGINSRVQQTEKPSLVPFPRGENITCLTAGTLHSMAVSLGGRVYGWGANDFGQLGNEATFRAEARQPIAIGRDLLNGEPAVSAMCGEYHSMVATDVGIYTFGSNYMGQLGRPGFDEWRPSQPIPYVLNRFFTAPAYASFLKGTDQCKQQV